MSGIRANCWGRAAEDEAAAWYRRRGGEVVARRVRIGGGELDLVVRLGALLVFVEVKARKPPGAALSALGAAQRRRWAQAAEAFIAAEAHALDGLDVRFDLAAADQTGGFEIIPDAWRPGWDAGWAA